MDLQPRNPDRSPPVVRRPTFEVKVVPTRPQHTRRALRTWEVVIGFALLAISVLLGMHTRSMIDEARASIVRSITKETGVPEEWQSIANLLAVSKSCAAGSIVMWIALSAVIAIIMKWLLNKRGRYLPTQRRKLPHWLVVCGVFYAIGGMFVAYGTYKPLVVIEKILENRSATIYPDHWRNIEYEHIDEYGEAHVLFSFSAFHDALVAAVGYVCVLGFSFMFTASRFGHVFYRRGERPYVSKLLDGFALQLKDPEQLAAWLRIKNR